MSKVKKFKNVILSGPMGGMYITIPFDVEKTYGKKRVRVKAMIEGIPYRGTIGRYKTKEHILIITKSIREATNKGEGDSVSITIEEDLEPRVVIVPEDFQAILGEHPTVKLYFEKLSYTHQKEYVNWITEAKRLETRERRLHKAITMMKNGKKGI